MSVWEKYSQEQREKYIQFLQVYGALTKLFYQKQGNLIPYLDSKFQETVFAKVFNGENVDRGNTPHDVLSVFGNLRVGIGIKTWIGGKPSFQKVMQLKKFQHEINFLKHDLEALAYKISEIKNEKMRMDYERLGLTQNANIYHYVTRDEGMFTINECAYPLINIHHLSNFEISDTAFLWSDGQKDYKYTFGDCQIWQKFDSTKKDSLLLNQFDIKIIDNPFDFLLNAYLNFIDSTQTDNHDIVEVYLPLYSFASQEVEEKSGLNAWNAAPKNKHSATLRPLNEIYIPVPIEFHRKFPHFFCPNILMLIEKRKTENPKPEVRFHFQLPNGQKIPALLTGSNMKNLQSGSLTEIDPNTGKPYGQSALGQWLLIDVLGLKDRQLVTREWLIKKETDSVRLWRKKDDYSLIYIDFAPVGSFEKMMQDETVLDDEN